MWSKQLLKGGLLLTGQKQFCGIYLKVNHCKSHLLRVIAIKEKLQNSLKNEGLSRFR